MLKRTLFFGSPGKLSIVNSLLAYESKDADGNYSRKTFPIEDIGFVVIESHQISITSACMSALAAKNTALILCDSSHMPTATMQPFAGNTLAQKYTKAQLQSSDAMKARLWKLTVKAKIINQAECLEKLSLPFKRLHILAKSVKNGDPDNTEAVAARYYFQQLGVKEFDGRDRYGEPPNHALNYGYAILRAAVARALIGSGLLCISGIHHTNQYNPFVLADDIMEPYRPIIDEAVFADRDIFDVPELGKMQKTRLLQLLTADVMIGEEKRPLLNAVSYTTASLAKCFIKEAKDIRYPRFVKNEC